MRLTVSADLRDLPLMRHSTVIAALALLRSNGVEIVDEDDPVSRAKRLARGEEQGYEVEPGIVLDDATWEALGRPVFICPRCAGEGGDLFGPCSKCGGSGVERVR